MKKSTKKKIAIVLLFSMLFTNLNTYGGTFADLFKFGKDKKEQGHYYEESSSIGEQQSLSDIAGEIIDRSTMSTLDEEEILLDEDGMKREIVEEPEEDEKENSDENKDKNEDLEEKNKENNENTGKNEDIEESEKSDDNSFDNDLSSNSTENDTIENKNVIDVDSENTNKLLNETDDKTISTNSEMNKDIDTIDASEIDVATSSMFGDSHIYDVYCNNGPLAGQHFYDNEAITLSDKSFAEHRYMNGKEYGKFHKNSASDLFPYLSSEYEHYDYLGCNYQSYNYYLSINWRNYFPSGWRPIKWIDAYNSGDEVVVYDYEDIYDWMRNSNRSAYLPREHRNAMNFDAYYVAVNNHEAVRLELFWQEKPKNDVSFIYNNNIYSSLIDVYRDDKIIMPTIQSDSGVKISGWYKEPECINKWDFDKDIMPDRDVVLYAGYEYDVVFNNNGHPNTDIYTEIKSASTDGKITAPADPVVEGWTFGGWYKEKECINKWDFDVDIAVDNIVLYAKWIGRQFFNVSYKYNNIYADTENYFSTMLPSGDKLTAPSEPTVPHFTFDGWFKEELCENPWDFENDIVESDTILYAKWIEHEKFIATFKNNGHPNFDTYTIIENIIEESKIEAPAIPHVQHYTFDGWYKEEECQNIWDFDIDIVNSNITLFAKWVEDPMFTVSFNNNGHPDNNTYKTTTVYKDSLITPPTTNPSVPHYTFGGWYKEETCENPWNYLTDLVVEDTTLFAKWNPILRTVSFNNNGYPNNDTYKTIENVMDGTLITAPTNPSVSHYTFDGWFKEETCENKWNFDTDYVLDDVILYAKWNPIMFDVIFYNNGHPNNEIYKTVPTLEGSTVVVPENPADVDGWTFIGWYSNQRCSSIANFNTPVTNVVRVYAKWGIKKMTVTFNNNGHPDNNTYTTITNISSGDMISAPSDPVVEGFIFKGWFKEETCENKWNFDTDIVEDDITLFAEWEEKEIEVSEEESESTVESTIESSEETREIETSIEEESETTTTEEESETTESTKESTTESTTESSEETREPETTIEESETTESTEESTTEETVDGYKVSFDMGGHGEQVEEQTIREGEKVVKPANPTDDNFIFDGWYKENEYENLWDFDTDTVSGDTTIYAKWVVTVYNVDFDLMGFGGHIDTQYVPYGERAERPADPLDENRVFVGWYKDSYYEDSFDFSSIIYGPTTIYAKWSATISSISILQKPTKLRYMSGEKFEPEGLVITRYYSDNTNDTLTYNGYEEEFNFDPSLDTELTSDITNVNVLYKSLTAIIDGIEVERDTTIYHAKFRFSGASLIYNKELYNDELTVDMHHNDSTFDLQTIMPYKKGHTFVNWQVGDNNFINDVWDYTEEDTYIDAVFEADSSYTVSVGYSPSIGNIIGQGYEYNIRANTEYHIQDCLFDRVGYDFLYWKKEGTEERFNPGDIIEDGFNESLVLSAVWEPKRYNIYYYNKDSLSIPYHTQTAICYGEEISILQNIVDGEDLGFTYDDNGVDVIFTSGQTLTLDNTNFHITSQTKNICLYKNERTHTYKASDVIFVLDGGHININNRFLTEYQTKMIYGQSTEDIKNMIPEKDGYNFIRYEVNGEELEDTWTYEDDTVYVYAIWEEKVIRSINVVYSSGNENATGIMDADIIPENTDYIIKGCDYTLDGYNFVKWNVRNTNIYYNPLDVVVGGFSEDIELVAVWEEKVTQYITVEYVKIDGRNRQTLEIDRVEANTDYVIKNNDLYIDGYVLYQWFDEETGARYFPGYVVSGGFNRNVVLIASMTQKVITVSYNKALNDAEGFMQSDEIFAEDDYTISDCSYTLEGYDFAVWYSPDEGKFYRPGEVVCFTNDIELYAQWTPKSTSEFSVDDNNNQSIISFTNTLEDETLINNDKQNTFGDANIINGVFDIVYYDNYKTSMDKVVDTGIRLEDNYQIKGCSFERPGYEFAGWQYYDEIFSYRTQVAPNVGETVIGENLYGAQRGQVDLFAKWVAKEYSITYKYSELGIGEDYTQNFVYGEHNLLQSNTSSFVIGGETYYQTGWGLNRDRYNYYCIDDANDVFIDNGEVENIVLYPILTLSSQTVVIKFKVDEEYANIFGNKYAIYRLATGDTIRYLDKYAKLTGHKCVGWKDEDGNRFNEATVAFTGTKTLTAIFEAGSYNVVFCKYPENISGNMPNQTINSGETTNISLNTYSRVGYNFVGWNKSLSRAKDKMVSLDDGNIVSNLGEPDSNVSLYPVWSPIEYTIHYVFSNGTRNTKYFWYGDSFTILNNRVTSGQPDLGFKYELSDGTTKTFVSNRSYVLDESNFEFIDGNTDIYLYGQSQKVLRSIEVEDGSIPLRYNVGDTINIENLVIKRIYSDDSFDTILYRGNETSFTFEPSLDTLLTTTNTTLTITYEDHTDPYSTPKSEILNIDVIDTTISLSFNDNAPISPSGEANTVVGAMPTIRFNSGDTLPTNTLSIRGYEFIGWSRVSKTPVEAEALRLAASAEIISDSDRLFVDATTTELTLYALWCRKSINVHLVQNESFASIPDPYVANGIMLYDQRLSDCALFNHIGKERNGYQAFTGMFTFRQIENPYAKNNFVGTRGVDYLTVDDVLRIDTDLTLYPLWKNVEYPITLNIGDGKMPERYEGVGVVVYYDAPYITKGNTELEARDEDGRFIEPKASPSETKMFEYWSYDRAGANVINDDTLYLDTTLNEIFANYRERNLLTISFAKGNGVGAMEADTVYEGIAYRIKKNTFTKTNYAFNFWSAVVDGQTNYYSDNQVIYPTTDMLLTANFRYVGSSSSGNGGGGGGGGAYDVNQVDKKANAGQPGISNNGIVVDVTFVVDEKIDMSDFKWQYNNQTGEKESLLLNKNSNVGKVLTNDVSYRDRYNLVAEDENYIELKDGLFNADTVEGNYYFGVDKSGNLYNGFCKTGTGTAHLALDAEDKTKPIKWTNDKPADYYLMTYDKRYKNAIWNRPVVLKQKSYGFEPTGQISYVKDSVNVTNGHWELDKSNGRYRFMTSVEENTESPLVDGMYLLPSTDYTTFMCQFDQDGYLAIGYTVKDGRLSYITSPN